MKKAILLFLMVSCWVFANAQQKTISGTISDESGSPLPGVNVVLKGTTVGTITDLDGNYSLEVPSDETILVISYLGYLSEEIQVGGQTTIDLTLTPSLEALEEVVVIGYGSVKKKDLTGAIAQVGGEDIASRNSTQISQALQGAMPGVTVTRNSSAPGATGTIRIRGITTMSNNDPLVIVDGVPGFGIDDVNPSDIENITVLKDAAAASIYGSQAAAGVILITTKRAKEGKTKLEYGFQYGIQVPTELPDYVDAQRYYEMQNEQGWNDAPTSAKGNRFPAKDSTTVADYFDLNREDPDEYPITDWTDIILNDYSTRQKHTLGFSVGAKNVKSFGSMSYEKSDALYDHYTYERYNVRLNNSIKVNKFISTDIDLAYKRSQKDEPYANPLGVMRETPPIWAATWSDGRVARGRDGLNVYGSLHSGSYKKSNNDKFNGKLGLYLKPIDGLKISGIVSPSINFVYKKNFKKAATYTLPDDTEGLDPRPLTGYENTYLKDERNNKYRITSQGLINYKKTLLGSHNIDLLAGYEYQYYKEEDTWAERDRFEVNTYPYLNLGPEDNQDNGGKANHLKRESVFGRAMYNYKSKYYVQANLRYDASSRFHNDNRWGAFPSFSAGWVVSEESFLNGVPVLSFLKLRASYGVLGNERINDQWFPYMGLISFSDALFYDGDDIISRLTAAQYAWVVGGITWETTRTVDFGIDFNLLDNKLRVTADYYDKLTSDMLLTAEMPDHSGYDDAQRNAGEMSSKGWEFVLSWKDRIGDVGYSASFHMSDNKTEMLEMSGKRQVKDGKITEEGSEYKEWYGLVSNGIWQSEEEIQEAKDNGYVLYENPEPGDVRYVDISGPDGVPDSVISEEYDRAYIGGSLPRYTYGGTIKLDYKGIDFSMVFQGVGKVNKKRTAYMVRPLRGAFTTIPSEVDGKYWSLYNSSEQNQGAKYPRLSTVGRNYATSDYWLFNGSYFRLKNVTLGYTLPKELTKTVGLSKVRVYTSVIDVFSINNYIKGWDPEVNQDSHPITRTFLVGAQVNF